MALPVSTVVWFDGLLAGKKRRWLVRFTCGHEAVVSTRPMLGMRRACRTCGALRTPRMRALVLRLGQQDLTEREVEYLAGRLAEQKHREHLAGKEG